MKKLTLLLALFLAIGLTVGFADEDQVTFELEGSASTTFGINLDENAAGNTASGLQNATDFDLDILLVSEQSAEKGEGDVYGWIQFEDFKVLIDFDDGLTLQAPDVNAELHIGPVYVDIDGSEDVVVDLFSLANVMGSAAVMDFDDPDPYLDPADSAVHLNYGVDAYLLNMIADHEATLIFPDVTMEDDFLAGFPDSKFTASGTLKVGYVMEDLLDVYVKIGSYNDWLERDADEVDNPVLDREHAYAVGFGAEVTPIGGLTLDADFIMGMNYEDTMPMAFGASAEYEFALNDTFTLVPFAGADILTKQGVDEDLAMEIGGGVKLLWPGYDDNDTNEFSNGLDADDMVSGASLSVSFDADKAWVGDDPYLNLVASVYQAAEEESPWPNLGVQAYLEWYDILNNYDMFEPDDTALGAGLYAEYAFGDFKPYGKFTYDMSDDDVTLTAGVEASMIPNTTFTLEYYSPRLIEHLVYADKYKGIITFATEISW